MPDDATAKHIGIVGVSAEGAALCYRTICNEAADLLGRHAHPEVTLHTHPLSAYMSPIEGDDWQAVGELMLDSADKLASVGAELLICPDNTVHAAWDFVFPRTPLPWLHIAEVVAESATGSGYRRLGVLGTRYLMEGLVYDRALATFGIENQIPGSEERERINSIIFDELVCGRFDDASRDYFLGVIDRLAERGSDAVVLGCTEIPLLVSPDASSLPVLDSTRLLARAALREASNA